MGFSDNCWAWVKEELNEMEEVVYCGGMGY